MMVALASLVCGLIFGLGLLISGMTQPAKVLGFLDVFGRWDPTLAFVMAAALMVSSVGFSLARQREQPTLRRPAHGMAGPAHALQKRIDRAR